MFFPEKFQNHNKLKLGLAQRQTVCHFCLHHMTAWGQGGEVRFQNNKLKLGLARRHTVWDFCLHHVTAWGIEGGEGRVRFQNNNRLKLGLARCHTVCRLLFTSRDLGGRGEWKVRFVYVWRHRVNDRAQVSCLLLTLTTCNLKWKYLFAATRTAAWFSVSPQQNLTILKILVIFTAFGLTGHDHFLPQAFTSSFVLPVKYTQSS